MTQTTVLPDSTGVLPVDVAELCDALAKSQQDLIDVETQQLRLAAHWIDLHAPEDHPDHDRSRRVLPGTERRVRSGADGTPMITEFACAEFAALLDMHPLAGAAFLRKVANLRHRHPLLWARVLRGEVRLWKALETARLVGRDELGLTQEQARWIDRESFEWITSKPWTSYVEDLERLIIDADPEAAETRRLLAETRQGVWTGQTSEHGLKTIVGRAAAGEMVYLTAVVNRLAEILAARGDAREIGPRRASALMMLAHPAHVLSLLAQHTAANRLPEPDGSGADAHPAAGDDDDQRDAGDAAAPEPEGGETSPSEPNPDGDDEPEPEPSNPCPSYLGCPEELRAALKELSTLGGPGLARFLPSATLYLHVDRDAFLTGRGSVHVEGVGVVTVQQATELLGHRRVTIAPVVDLSTPLDPVDGYVFPRRMRERLHLTNPRDVFPFGVNTSRSKDIDHPIPYVSPDNGGPPGQTGLHNAAPMTRFHHRLKTFGRWRVSQIGPGAHLWQSPHRHCWLVDANGTHKIPSAVLPWLLKPVTRDR